MTERHLKTSWDGHYMLPAFYDFLYFAMGEEEIMAQYRAETGDAYRVPASAIERMIDEATGRDFAFLQSFSDWCERRHFGTPADMGRS